MVEWWLQVPGPAVGSEVRKSQGSGNDGAPAEAVSLGEARPEGSGSLGWGVRGRRGRGVRRMVPGGASWPGVQVGGERQQVLAGGTGGYGHSPRLPPGCQWAQIPAGGIFAQQEEWGRGQGSGRCLVEGQICGLWSWAERLPLPGCVTSGKSLNLSVPLLSHL